MPTTKATAPELKVPVSDMVKIAKKERMLIEKDARDGITQEPVGGKTSPYRSEPYKKYKSNYMKRFTDRTGAKGTKLKAYTGRSIASNQTSTKNYTLTALMWRRLHTQSPKVNEVTVAFDPADRGKVLGARDDGDELVGQNNKNVNIILKMILKKYDKEIKKWSKKDLNLTIG